MLLLQGTDGTYNFFHAAYNKNNVRWNRNSSCFNIYSMNIQDDHGNEKQDILVMC